MRRARTTNRQAWEEIAATDPDWGVLTQGSYQSGTWDGRLDEFYASGRHEVARVLGHPLLAGVRRDLALDFGCGTGRLSFALAEIFDRVVAIDASRTMLSVAAERALERQIRNLSFVHVDDPSQWPRDVSFVLSLIVLQHLPSKAEVREILRRISLCMADDALAVIEMPTELASRRARLRVRYHIHGLLRALPVPRAWYSRRLNGMSMMAIGRREFEIMLASVKLEVLRFEAYRAEGVEYGRYFAGPNPGRS